MNRIKALMLTLLMFLLVAACSSQFPTEEEGSTGEAPGRSEPVPGEQQQALEPACSITGSAGIADTTYVTQVRIVAALNGTKLAVDHYNVDTHVRNTDIITFKDVHWTPFHSVNGMAWLAQNDSFPLRKVDFKDQGCELNFPDKYCLFLYGDLDFGDHVNEFQNTEVFLFDRPISPVSAATGYPWFGEFIAPFGYGITKIEGMGTTPTNTLKISGINATHTGVATKTWKFTTPGCP
jgi:hypothetical protein